MWCSSNSVWGSVGTVADPSIVGPFGHGTSWSPLVVGGLIGRSLMGSIVTLPQKTPATARPSRQ
jgi:hypothetical protein